MEKERYGVLMIDVSKSDKERQEDIREASEVITHFYPEMYGHIFCESASSTDKYSRIADVIRVFGISDVLFCNTCGDEIDHLYRFVRAIAKNAGLEIIPVQTLREQLRKENDHGECDH